MSMPQFERPAPRADRARIFALAFSLIALLSSPAGAKDSAAPSVTRATSTSAAPTTGAATDEPGQTKRAPLLTDAPTGAKTPQALAQKLADAYKNRDTGAYLALLKASVRTRIRMQLLFKREAGYPVSNFKYLTLEQEATRLKVKKETLIGPKEGSGTEERFELPVCGFVNYEFATTLTGRPDIESVAVGKSKDLYFLQVRRVPKAPKAPGAAGDNGAAAATPAAVSGSPTTATAPAPSKPAAAVPPTSTPTAAGAPKSALPAKTHATKTK